MPFPAAVLLFVAGFLCSPALAIQDSQGGAKAQPPLPLEQEKALDLVKDIYAADYAAQGAEKRRALAGKLLAQAGKEKDDTTRFVLLSEAVKAASQGGDLSAAFSSVDRIEGAWAVDSFDLKKSALGFFKPGKKPGLLEKEITARAYLDLVDVAISADRYKDALAVCEDAQEVIDRLGAREFKSDLKMKKARVEELSKAFGGLRQQYLRLLEDPDDTAANLAVGDFYSEKKKDPGAGAPFLARTRTHVLSEVSRADVAAASGEGSLFEAGEGWADLYLAGKKKRPDFRDRALYWYGRSLAKSTGLERTRVLQRMREIRGDLRELLKPLKPSEFRALVWKDAASGWAPTQLSALNPVRKSGSLVVRNPSDRMFSYLVCTPDVRGDFTAQFTVKGAVGVGLLRGSGRSIRGAEIPLRGGTARVVIERSGKSLVYKLGKKKMTPRQLGYPWANDRNPQHIFFRIPRKKLCYLSSVQFYQEPIPPAEPGSNPRGQDGRK